MTDELGYGTRTLTSIEKQCERRGILPEEMDSVLASVKEKFGKSLAEMNESELKRVNRQLDVIFVDYLEGAKRRGEAPGLWAGGESTAGGSAAIS